MDDADDNDIFASCGVPSAVDKFMLPDQRPNFLLHSLHTTQGTSCLSITIIYIMKYFYPQHCFRQDTPFMVTVVVVVSYWQQYVKFSRARIGTQIFRARGRRVNWTNKDFKKKFMM